MSNHETPAGPMQRVRITAYQGQIYQIATEVEKAVRGKAGPWSPEGRRLAADALREWAARFDGLARQLEEGDLPTTSSTLPKKRGRPKKGKD